MSSNELEATKALNDENEAIKINETNNLLKNKKDEEIEDKDLEKGEVVMEREKEKLFGKDDQTMLIGYEDLKKFKNSPFWKILRFLLFGGLAFIFVALVTISILIVIMSSKCEELPEGAGLVRPKEDPLPLVYPRQLKVLLGEEAIFNCEFPKGQVEWRRLDQNGLFAEFPSGIENPKNGQLKIPKVELNHQGDFACQVKDEKNKNKNLNTPQVVRLFVLGQGGGVKEKEEEKSSSSRNGREELPPLALKPRVDSYLKIASAGEPVHFRCWNCQFAECRTSHRLVWQRIYGKNKEAEVLKSFGPLSIERDTQSVFLIFQEVNQTDAGIYECLDEGTGALSSQVHLQVEPRELGIIINRKRVISVQTLLF
ncbi:hypothetical protein Mgra_00007091 [Meloidogyne graminicola]|uniref:Ig-like domain-containing protein n=1 Tax=Meloidogyne graminicola TaxID=189291 RepID=A0A8S9ZJN4_9BILA|nr:hypothetical protein Mgra_00007091 [Meloidogyne graminicola]